MVKELVGLLSIVITITMAEAIFSRSNPLGALNRETELIEKLKLDTAILTISKPIAAGNFAVVIFTKSDECYKCSYHFTGNLEENDLSKSLIVDTRWPVSIQLVATAANCSTTFHYHYGEYGHYSTNFTISSLSNGTFSCAVSSVQIEVNPSQSYLPIFIAFLILAIFGLFYAIGQRLYEEKTTRFSGNQTNKPVSNNIQDIGSSTVIVVENGPTQIKATPRQKRKRLVSIDTFRGLSLVIMIFVNYGGGKYWFFEHATWNGLTVADLVFPWFMFIMGVSITFSVESLLKRTTPRREIAYKVIRRTLILFALGLTIININTNWTGFRVPGVLQRFAIAYIFAFSIQWAFHKSPKDLIDLSTKDSGERRWWFVIRDIVLYWPQWIIVFMLEALWLLLTFLLPVPGCPTGYIGPGGLADNGKYMNSSCIGGAAGYIDRWMFGDDHIYGYPTPKGLYYPYATDERVPFDPEGVLGSINGCVIVFLGTQMGKIFLYYDQPKSRTIRWICWAIVFGAISIILCKASANEGWIPVNKNLWTITFVTTLSCFAFLLMIVIYWLVDVLEWWSGSPFDFVGMNSIFIYAGHQTFSYYIPFSWGADEYSTHAEWLAMNSLGVFYWIVIAYYCYKIKFFIKI